MKKKGKQDNWYLTSADIFKEWVKWRDSAERVEDRIIPEQLGKQMLDVATHLLAHKRFCNYPKWMKDEMVSDAVVKIMRNLKNMKESFKDCFFSYFTRCSWTAFVVYLGNHYKELNRKKQMLVDALENAMDELPANQTTNEIVDGLKDELSRYDEPITDEMEIC